MSEEARPAPIARNVLVVALTAGLAAGALYASVFLALAFLLPVQVAFGKRGSVAGLVAAGVAVIAAVGIQLGRAIASGLVSIVGQPSIIDLLTLAGPPAVLLGALCLMNARFWDKFPGFWRPLAATALCSAFAIPSIIALEHDATFSSLLEERIRAMITPLLANIGEGYEGAVTKASLDPALLVAQSKGIIVSSFSAFLFALFGVSRWFGNRISGSGTPGRAAYRPITDYRLPYAFVWPFLAAWAGVLASHYFEAPSPFPAIAWNCALVFSLAYTVQGIGIASHLMKRWNLPRSLRICLTATAVMVFAMPPIGTATTAILPLLGVTETWIPYRNPKGVGA